MVLSLAQIKSELGAVVAGAPPGLPAANRLCTACVDLLGVDGAAISMILDGEPQGTFGSSSSASRRLDEFQFTLGEGPCLDAAATRKAVLVPDLDSPDERRWPVFSGEVLGDGIRAVFALPVMITSVCVGALDLFRAGPGPLAADQLAGGLLAAELGSLPLLDLIAAMSEGASSQERTVDGVGDGVGDGVSGGDADGDADDGWGRLAELDRVEVYQATGMLIAQLDVDAAEALVRLRAYAMATGQTASEAAWAIAHRELELPRDDRGSGRPGKDGGR